MISADNCVHCHKCRDACAFLTKYNIDIGDTERLSELAFHCFLCGRCTAVCPVGIDGRGVIMDMRRARVASPEKAEIEKTYKGLIGEKRDYRFRNWKHVSSGSVFFPGCNFPSMFPKTNAKLVNIFAEHDIGTVYECCGKPVAELGLAEDEERIISDIRDRLLANGVTEVVTACPNCRDFFGDRLGVTVKSVYTKLKELGKGEVISGDVAMYVPCPDRTSHLWIEEIRPFIGGEIRCTDAAQCCGLGGSAAMMEKDLADGFANALKMDLADGFANALKMDLADGFADALKEASGDQSNKPNKSGKAEKPYKMYTYCASCAGQFRRMGLKDIDHVLPRILGTDEQPDTKKSYINRVLTRFK